MDFHQISSDKSYSKILQTKNPQQCYDDEQTNQNGEHQVDVDIVDNQREEGGLSFQLRDENDSVKRQSGDNIGLHLVGEIDNDESVDSNQSSSSDSEVIFIFYIM